MTFEIHPAKLRCFYSSDLFSPHEAISVIMASRPAISSGNKLTDHLIWEGRISDVVRLHIRAHSLGKWLTAHNAQHQLECSLYSYQGDYQLVVYVTLFDEVLASAFCMTWC